MNESTGCNVDPDHDDGYGYDDFGGWVQPKEDCPHIVSHVRFRIVNGELTLAPQSSSSSSSSSSSCVDDDDNDDHGTSDGSGNNTGIDDGEDDYNIDSSENEEGMRHEFQRLHLNAPKAIMAPCQHFECVNRRNRRHKNRFVSGGDKGGEPKHGDGDGEADEIMGGENKDCNDDDDGNENKEEEEEKEKVETVEENWLCLECGILLCSRYQFGHAKLHYETTKLQQQKQKGDELDQMEDVVEGEDRKMKGKKYDNDDEENENERRRPTAEGHCIAVSMADLSVWCYECNSYLRHPRLHELTKHLEGLKFGSKCDVDAEEEFVGKDGENEVSEKVIDGNGNDNKAEQGDDNAEEEVADQADGMPSNDRKNEANTSSASSSSTSTSKRKGQPPKRRAPDSHNHEDWSYQKFKPDDGHNTRDDDGSSSLEGGEEDIASLLERRHGDMLRAYLARHESFDTSNMGQCVPMHVHPPSFPDEMADFLRSPLCKSIIVLAGAGMSVSCGIPDFRSAGVGLYDTLRPELLTASAEERALIESDPTLALDKGLFLQNPLPMLETKRSFILGTYEKKWKATLAHRFVELLHTKLGKLTRLYTQNIDGLEYQTSIPKEKMVNVHGSMGKAACEVCKHGMDFDQFCGKVRTNIKDITGQDVDAPTESTPIVCDKCGNPTVKPSIVLFRGSLPKVFYKRSAKDLPDTDLLIIMGTSLSVAPANSLVFRIPPTALRLVMNNEPVGRRLGIDYSQYAFRDVWAQGSTDESCLNLAEKMGWLDDLALIVDELPDSSARLLRQKLALRKAEEASRKKWEEDDDDESDE